jgi:hypothetical protein
VGSRASYSMETRGRGPLRAGGRSRWVAGVGAVILGDLLLGFAAFSSITLASLWYFSWEWIQLRAEYVAHGLVFGTAWQLALAWVAVVVAFPLLAVTLLLAVSALRLPGKLYRYLRGQSPSPPAAPKVARPSVRNDPFRPDYVASFWGGSR